MTQLGPDISMSLSPAFFLEQLTDLDEFFVVRVDDGEVTEGKGFLEINWSPFQVRTVTIFCWILWLVKMMFRNLLSSTCIDNG